MATLDTSPTNDRPPLLEDLANAFTAFDRRVAELDAIFCEMNELHARGASIARGIRETEARQLAVVLRALTASAESRAPRQRQQTAMDLVRLDAVRRTARQAHAQPSETKH